MADVRALLRQQRASRRIQHPLATYTDAGKLLCTICHEHVRTESLWDKHTQSDGHQRRLQQAEEKEALAEKERRDGAPHDQDAVHPGTKRKLDDEQDSEMVDATSRKRSKPDVEPGVTPKDKSSDDSGKDRLTPTRDAALTPPGLLRRKSNTPSQGVELQIPSRPATPSRASSSATPQTTSRPISQSRQPSSSLASEHPLPSQPHVDEAEWAAFEADMAVVANPRSALDDDAAVISAPPMTAEQAAAQRIADADRDWTQAEWDLEVESEEARRNAENEFDDMHDLEERVRRLKERRESLRRHVLNKASDGPPANGEVVDKTTGGDDDDDDDDDEDEDDDGDYWAGMRFRTG